MLITTPSEIKNVWYEGTLEFSETSVERMVGAQRGPTRKEIEGWERPRVTIGEPLVWNVAEVYRAEGKPLPTRLALLLRAAEAYVVQLACSFWLARDTHVEWARFSVYLQPRDGSASPLALDLHPLEVYDQVQRDVRIVLDPSLKFGQVAEASLGEVALELKYNELVPVVTATGVQESHFSWDLRKTDEYPLQGTRFFHALIQRPREAQGVRAIFTLEADVVTPRGLLQGAIHRAVSEGQARVICV